MQKLLRLSDNISKYLIAAILIVIPVYPKFPFFKIFGTYVAVRLEDFLLAVLAGLAVIKLIPRVKELLKNKTVRAMAIFLLIGLISVISGALLTKTVSFPIGMLHLIRRVEYFIPFFFVLAFFQKDKARNLEFFLKTLMVSVGIVFIFGLGQKYMGFPVVITQNAEYSKGIALRYRPGSQLNSTFAGHYDLAAFMVMVLPIFWAMFFKLKGNLTKIFLGIVLISGLWLLSATASRISAVAYLGGCALALVLLKKYKTVFLMAIVSLIFFATSSSLLGRYGQIFKVLLSGGVAPVYAQSTTPVSAPVPVLEDRSTSIRLNVEWPRAIRALEKNPLLGTGYSSINLATDNDFLRALGEVGVLGFAAFVLILVSIVVRWIKFLPKLTDSEPVIAAFMAGIMGAFAGVLLNAVFIDVFEASKFAITFWLMIGLSLQIANE